ncbi:MAG: hypothetical protein R3B41_03915 [Candidatus Doudnabacteria bacterium]
MLDQQILDTIKFFDLQEYPLTSFEVWRYLISGDQTLLGRLDQNYDLITISQVANIEMVELSQIVEGLDRLVDQGRISKLLGFLYFTSKQKIY